jgi:hypothetical protein
MRALSLEEKHDLLRMLNELRDERRAEEFAMQRARQAQVRCRNIWTDIVRTYGESNAPAWPESLYGPRPKP